MRPLLLAAALLAASPAWAQRPIPDVDNGPGLQCWGIRGGPSAQVFVFAAPDTIAEKIGRVSSWTAVTGPARNAFLPVETQTGTRGWVMEESIERGRWIGMKCVARRDERGHVYFVYGGQPPR
ncbi:SH3 domain-containing protein [Roseomonas mucosa]